MMAWCRYLYWADLMGQHAESLYDQDATEKEGHFERWFPLMSHWYATLYVVVEGWMELGFRDPIIDKLLAHK
jgi:hypothetical protein